MVCTPHLPSLRQVLALLLVTLLAVTIPAAPVAGDHGGPGPGPMAVDLVIESVDLLPAAPEPGDLVTMWVRVANLGPDDVLNEFAVNGYGGGYSSFGWSTYVYGLGAGNNTTLKTTWYATEAVHDMTFRVDAYEWVAETNETNNAHTFQLIVGDPKPDFDVEGIFLLPSDTIHGDDPVPVPWPTVIRDGDQMTLHASIDNEGTAPVDQMRVHTYLDDVLIDEQVLDHQGGWGGFTLLVNWTATLGDHRFRVVADPMNEVAEKNETNNEGPLALTVLAEDAPVPDLAVVDVEVPESPAAGDFVAVTATLRNDGNASAEAFNAYLSVGGVGTSVVRFPGLDAGEEASITVVGEVAADQHYFGGKTYYSVVVDPFFWDGDDGHQVGGEVPEDNETNNYWGGAIDLRLPDLVVSDVRFPEGGRLGEETSIEIDIANIGQAVAHDTFQVELYGDVWGTYTVPTWLTPGSSWTLVVPTVLGGQLFVGASVDSDRDLGEEDESNIFTFERDYLTDLGVTYFEPSDERPWTGETIILQGRVGNLGEAWLDGFDAELYVDGRFYQQHSFEGMDENGEIPFQFEWTTLDDEQYVGRLWGEHTFEVIIYPWYCCGGYDEDPDNDRAETSAYVKLTPLPPWI